LLRLLTRGTKPFRVSSVVPPRLAYTFLAFEFPGFVLHIVARIVHVFKKG